ncbi:hypothetical protein GN244_ATG20260 [Phytophthora infestans]|uniref:Uncharacterized protein n=1 Tax=Phytophthora infestans TaxID=4787 RepID=A0A833STB4_PHYIN|nr:hypothetical protein GN244_ATG20260 [Phytophthora infestans]
MADCVQGRPLLNGFADTVTNQLIHLQACPCCSASGEIQTQRSSTAASRLSSREIVVASDALTLCSVEIRRLDATGSPTSQHAKASAL